MHPPDTPPALDPGPLLQPAPLPRGMRKEIAALVGRVAGGGLARDVVFLMPSGAIDRGDCVPIAEARDGEIATIEAEVEAHLRPHHPRAPYRVRLRDESGFLTIAFFRAREDMAKRMWPVGARRLVSGKVEHFGAERQMLHPDHVVDPATGQAPPRVEPVYPLTAGLPGRAVQRMIKEALPLLGEAPEWLDPAVLAAHAWPGFSASVRRQHAPEARADVAPEGVWRTRLAYDELFLRQCVLQLRRAERRARRGRAVSAAGRLEAALLASLPYAPTHAQARAAREIAADMGQASPMLRLLQGDVGSGKTLVAALAMVRAAEAGLQSALMAPTEILARQHGEGLIPLLQAAGVRAALLTGRDKGAARAEVLKGLAAGEIGVAVGTHALFQDRVAFHDLGLIVIDEQNRFGVSDRMRLVAKGGDPHVLAMSATPIPRTLALAAHGDMDISALDEKPPGRAPIRTVAMPIAKADELADAIADAAARGERAYWVCPVIEGSETQDLAAVEARHEQLQARFGEGAALVHGRMSAAARDAAMERFRTGQCFLLVATTVIEVGVNVPEATIMVIEHAERFGLAQLHQLRGRVGRGQRKGFCVLLWRAPLGEAARARLDTLRRTEDGFAIAEADYKLRGMGDLMGVRQSGLPPFRFVSPDHHGVLLAAADQDARVAIARDPDLKSARGRAIAYGLKLFGLDEGGALARSG